MEWTSERLLSLLLYGAINGDHSNSIPNKSYTLKLSSSSPMLENDTVSITELGSGAQGFVYNVVKTKEPYFVIKAFKAGNKRSFEMENQFFDIQMELDAYHNNVIKRLEVLKIKDGPGLYHHAMLLPKYIMDAFTFLMEKLFPTETPMPNTTERLAMDVINGLNHIHTNFKLAHCDIKPENIMIMKIDPIEFVIVDFGLVLSMNEEKTKKLLTTRYYNRQWIKCSEKPQGVDTIDSEIIPQQRGEYYIAHLKDHIHPSQVWLSSGFLSVPLGLHGSMQYQPDWRGIDTSQMPPWEVSKLVDVWGLMTTLFMFQLFTFPWNAGSDLNIPFNTFDGMKQQMKNSIDGCFKNCKLAQGLVQYIIKKTEATTMNRKRPRDDERRVEENVFGSVRNEEQNVPTRLPAVVLNESDSEPFNPDTIESIPVKGALEITEITTAEVTKPELDVVSSFLSMTDDQKLYNTPENKTVHTTQGQQSDAQK